MSLAFDRPDVRPCTICRQPEMAGYPHHHDRPVRGDYDPMGPRPARLYCAELDVDAYWTLPAWRPACCLVHVVAAEHRAELPDALHPVRYRPPPRTEPIPLRPGDPDGPTLEVLDAGQGWPWASAAHRRFGARGRHDGRDTIDRRDWAAFPWAYAVERRLDGHCRRRHVTRPDLWPEHDARALCVTVVRRIVVDGVPPEWVALEAGVPPIRLRPMLDDALRAVWRFVSEDLNGIGARVVARKGVDGT